MGESFTIVISTLAGLLGGGFGKTVWDRYFSKQDKKEEKKEKLTEAEIAADDKLNERLSKYVTDLIAVERDLIKEKIDLNKKISELENQIKILEINHNQIYKEKDTLCVEQEEEILALNRQKVIHDGECIKLNAAIGTLEIQLRQAREDLLQNPKSRFQPEEL